MAARQDIGRFRRRRPIIEAQQLRERLGTHAKETMRENFLMSRLVADWLDPLASYERPVRQ